MIVIRLLEANKFDRATDARYFNKALEWISNFPEQLGWALKQRLGAAFRTSFGVSEAEVAARLAGKFEALTLVREELLENEDSDMRVRALLPRGGWFEWYDAYTRENEAPLSYHVFSSLCVLSAVLGRRIYIDMGFFKVYPTCRIVLVGPPGRVKKTSATDIALDLVKQLNACETLPDKITPERLVTVLAKNAYRFLCAEEMCFFFGKQEYSRGMVPLMLKVLSDRETIEVETQTRELELISGLCVTFLAGTTPALLASSVPQEVVSSGFLSRILLVHENDTTRKFRIPRKGPHENKILAAAERVRCYSGAASFTPEADRFHTEWYDALWERLRECDDEMESDMLSRTQIHMLRISLLMHLVQCDNLHICLDCLQRAASLVDLLSKSSPILVRSLRQNSAASETDFVVDALIRMGGASDHSKLLRRSRMTAQQFKQHIRTLEEAGRIAVTKKGVGVYYTITGGRDARG